MIKGINESKTLTKHISCECKCKFDGEKFNSGQWWNNDKCWCGCQKRKVIQSHTKNIHEKSYRNILIYYIGYVAIKDLKYIKIDSVNPFCLVFSNVNGYFVKVNGIKYLTLVPNNGSKRKNMYDGLWTKFTDLVRLITKKSDDYFEKYMNIKFNLDDELPSNKTIEIPSMIIVVRVVFHKSNKYYPKSLLDEFLYKS